MTHLAADIRSDSLIVLEWLLECAGDEAVCCPGGWLKTLKAFLAMLGWQENNQSKNSWVSSKSSLGKSGAEGKVLAKQLSVLAQFLRIGLIEPPRNNPSDAMQETAAFNTFPLWDANVHLMPKQSNCYTYLNLFGSPRDEEGQMYEDIEDRQSVFGRYFESAIESSVDVVRKEGGEVGRAAAILQKILKDAATSSRD
jgi:pre-rRNA-processing protein IPI1